MEKALKKEIERNLKKPTGKYVDIIGDYLQENAGNEKSIIIKYFFFEKCGYWRVIKELNKIGVYVSHGAFYNIKDIVVTDIALRACYEHLVCPYGDKSQLK